VGVILSDISLTYKDLLGTEHQFSGSHVWHRLNIGTNMVIAVFGAECVKVVHCDFFQHHFHSSLLPPQLLPPPQIIII
jgi:hypothetical protein